MKIKPIAAAAVVAAALAVLPTATAYASCSMAAGKADSLTSVLEDELVRAAPYKPGSDARDVVWLKDNMVAMVPDWLATTKGIVADGRAEIDRVVDECYRPGDYSVAGPVRFDFIACAKKGALAHALSLGPSTWSDVCGEVRAALDDPAITQKVRTWARSWVDKFIDYVRHR